MLEQSQKKLDMWVAIDKIRDTAPDPTAMMSSIADLLATTFETNLCLLAIVDQETREPEITAVKDRDNLFAKLGTEGAEQLAERAMEAETIRTWKGDEALKGIDAGELPDQLEVAAVPIVMGPGEKLGAMLLMRTGSPFEQAEIDLLETAESQIDSAVVQAHIYYRLRQRNKELETIYKIDRIRDEDLPFDEMLDAAARELHAVIDAKMAFVMLYKMPDEKLVIGAVTHDELREAAYLEEIKKHSREALEKAEMIYHNDLKGTLKSVMCIPLILRDRILGVFGVVDSPREEGFVREDRRLLTAIASQLDTAIFESFEQRHLLRLLGRAVDPRVMKRLLANPDVTFLKGERTFLSVLYVDIRDSTGLAQRTEPELLVEFINDYLGKMSSVVLTNEGTIDKFVGDEVIALFSAPFYQEDHALRAVQVGLEMQKAHNSVMETWREKGIDKAPIGVGIATGELIAGEMGSEQRTDYTVIGSAANLGSRICSLAEAGQVLISQETYDLVKDRIEAKSISGVEVKGVSDAITIYDVVRVIE
jgi:class 3 adenylate cyclase